MKQVLSERKNRTLNIEITKYQRNINNQLITKGL